MLWLSSAASCAVLPEVATARHVWIPAGHTESRFRSAFMICVTSLVRRLLTVTLLLAFASGVRAQVSPETPDIPKKYEAPASSYDYVKREVMVPMRDAVRLHTVIVIPRGASRAPIILTRTPYNASGRAEREASPHMLGTLPQGDEVFVAAGYIRVFQDVRGKYGSEGGYLMTRPLRGPLNSTSTTDESTDAYDTIDWLVKNVPESNGKIGMLGSSYEGFTVVMALINPHPALQVAAPMSPMVDGWMGDDWFHFGAFRQVNLDYFTEQTAVQGEGHSIVRQGYDDYENFLRAGSAGNFAKAAGLDQLPWWRKMAEHPAYDSFWQLQALDKTMAAQPLKVPTMWIQGLWDQEDMWGAIHCYLAVEPEDHANNMNFLVMGPWRHSGVNYDGYSAKSKPLYLSAGFGLSFAAPEAPAGRDSKASKDYDEYASDPAKPVPYQPRPVRFADTEAWRRWLLMDQRSVVDRPDVLAYVTPPLTEPVRISGAPVVNLVASTSGTDSDWVVKLIDVYPDEVPSQPEMGGYQLNISMDIFRGRYRESFETPKAIAPNTPLPYKFTLPMANHVFLPGHRIMVQIQSSWFPLYDRNPQKFVPNIFFAKPEDYVKATQRIYRAPGAASFIDLPLFPAR